MISGQWIRRTSSIATAFLLATTVLAACSGGGKDKGEEASSSASASSSPSVSASPSSSGSIPADKEFEISLMDWQDPKSKYAAAYNYAFDEYMKLHPNVKIKHIYQPNNGYDTLLDTQYVAHKAPDAAQMFSPWINKYTDQEYLLRLDEYMHEESPYNAGKPWVDTFINGESSFSGMKSRNKFGAISFVPVDGGIGQSPIFPFFYNKSILDKAGVSQLPSTWAEFTDALKKVKEAGFVPVTVDNNRFLNWSFSWVGSQFGENYLDQFFDAKYAGKALYEDKALTALLTGKIGKDDPAINSMIDIMKDFSQYWQDGWAGASEQESQQLFVFGKAAFILDGNWMLGYYEENIKDFEVGVMPFPLITKQTSPYAAEAMPAPGDQVDYGWGLNKDLEKDPDKLKVVIDLFRFITSKDVQAKMADIGVWAPVSADVAAPDKMKPFLATEKNTLQNPLDNPMYNYASDAVAISQVWLTGKADKAEYLDKMSADNKKLATQRVKDSLDEKIGLPNQIAELEKQLDGQKSAGSPEVVIKATENSLSLAKLKLEFYKQYAEPALK